MTTPEAVLFDNPARRVVNHLFSPNPVEGGTIRATWQSTRNSSVFWGKMTASATSLTDPDFVGNKAFVPYEADYVFYTDPTATTAASEPK